MNAPGYFEPAALPELALDELLLGAEDAEDVDALLVSDFVEEVDVVELELELEPSPLFLFDVDE